MSHMERQNRTICMQMLCEAVDECVQQEVKNLAAYCRRLA